MDKAHAIKLLGGSIHSAAATLKVTYQAVKKWPDPLPDRIEARVIAEVARQKLGDRLAEVGLGSATHEVA